MTKIDRELNGSRELEAPGSLIRHLEAKRSETEQILESLEKEVLPAPSRSEILAQLQNMESIWPSFNANERCRLVANLLKRVDFDNTEGKVTLHFKESAFLEDSGKEVA